MITGELRSKVDKIWEIFWTGGITNPLSVIEQFTYLLFIKGLDDKQKGEEKLAEFVGTDFNKIFNDDQYRKGTQIPYVAHVYGDELKV